MKTHNVVHNLTILVLVLFITIGCKSILSLKYGVRSPKEETPEGLISFLEKQKFPICNMYIFSDSASYSRAFRNRVFSKNLLSYMNFDKDGILLVRDTTKCQWAGNDFIKVLNKDSTYKKWAGFTLSQILDHIQPISNNSGQDILLRDPDFTVVVTWAKFLGKYNYRLFDLAGAVKENKRSRIRIIWLNVDMQESWHLTGQQKLFFK